MNNPIYALALAALLMATTATAQVSLDELDQAMEGKEDLQEEVRLRLNDENPDRAMAAMRLLIEKGDDRQRKLAVSHGLSSTNHDVQLAAVEAIFNSDPILVTRWYSEDGPKSNNWRNAVGNLGGAIEVDGTARLPIRIARYSDEDRCWVESKNNRCAFRINSGEITFNTDGGWTSLTLDAEGKLVGERFIARVPTRVVVDLGA
ncbi:hypothetical protein MU516_12715 [Paracoccus sp. YLB-12]|uniref:HEAT repeat domain-containing protein n=1 Tax=Paracoccus maritimus TaxID=2933292 RepID=A0ABT2KB30_9RHOB|nr:hypothetical protein [Paracoccus sp. YLB-12]MCT4333728.1 hypothetical protein [Paracoccus sp. YLB-12]